PIRVGVCRRENARLGPVYEQAVKSGKADYDFACKAARESSALSVSAVVFEGRNKNFRAVTSDLLRLALSRDRNKLPQLRDAKPSQHEDDDGARRSCDVPLPGRAVPATARGPDSRHRIWCWSSIDVFRGGDTQSR